jgi:flagellar motor switch protein FliG
MTDKQTEDHLTLDVNGLNGIQKAAVLLISLGVEKAAKILKKLDESEVEKLTIAIAKMEDINSEMVESVRKEYHGLIQTQVYAIEGGTDYAHNLLAESIGEKKADEIMKKYQIENEVDAFGLFQQATTGEAVRFLKKESPQMIAVILAHLEIEKAAEILTALPEDIQANTAYRLANMSHISAEVVEELEEIIKDEIGSGYGEIDVVLKGASAVANILNKSDLNTERKVLENIKEFDDELASEIKQQMFLFEDILELEDRTLQEIISRLDNKDMVMGLKGEDEKLRKKFVDNMSKRAGEILLDDLDALGAVHVSQVEESQQEIISIIRKLDEEGKIAIREDSNNIIE